MKMKQKECVRNVGI